MQALLNSTSSALHSATSGRLRFGSVAVQLPPSWPSKCLVSSSGRPGRPRQQHNASSSGRPRRQQQKRAIESVPASGLTEPDVSVVRESILAGSRPWTEQYGGCGVRGLRVRLPSRFLDGLDGEDDGD